MRDPVIQAANQRATVARITARNRAFVAEVNARTVCAHCGAEKIEWHNPEHVELGRQRFRIHAMVVGTRSIAAIEAELARCTPLCRRCHMVEDGRLRALAALGTARQGKERPPKSCTECRRLYKPLRSGLCSTCYDRRRWPSRRESHNERRRDTRERARQRRAGVTS